MEKDTIISIIAFMVALFVGIAMIILYKRRVIDEEIISGANQVLGNLPAGTGVFGAIANYAKIAVHTVEQLVKTGQISKDSTTRKDAAMAIVENAAMVDEVPFGAAEQEAASACIEAEVQLLPRNQKPPAQAEQTD